MKKIAILHGEIAEDAGPDEQDTLVQAASVAEGLSKIGYLPFFVPVPLNLEKLRFELLRSKPDMVFNLVEALAGRGDVIHLVPALLDVLAIPYTGAPTEALYVTSNKLLAKTRLVEAGLPTPFWLDGAKGVKKHFEKGDCIVKSVWEHASMGLDEDSVFAAADSSRVAEVIAAKKNSPGAPWFAERYVEGREFNVALLARQHPLPCTASMKAAGYGVKSPGADEPDVLPMAEICFDAYPPGKVRVVGYRAKWEEGSFEFAATGRNFVFASDDGPLLEKLAFLSMQCWRLFGLRGYARVDFRVDNAGIPWILEINANPCLSADAGFMAAAARAGLSFTDVLQRIIVDALE